MALVSVLIYRNHSSSDTTNVSAVATYSTFEEPSDYGYDAPFWKQFKEWNTNRSGTGTSFSVGDTISPDYTSYYAIWEEIPQIDYLTTDKEITSVANAIRAKSGTSSSLEYPTEFVSAINDITTGGGRVTQDTQGNLHLSDDGEIVAETPLSVTQNGTYTPSTGYAYSSVSVSVSGTDVSDTTATASDVRTGKYFYTAAGVKTQGSIGNGTTTQNTPTVNSSTGVVTATATVTAGYQSADTKSNTLQLTTQAAQTIHPSTTDQTIASGKYLTGTQTVKGVLLTNLDAGNIKKDVVVKIGDSTDDDCVTSITGSYEGGGSVSNVTIRINYVYGGEFTKLVVPSSATVTREIDPDTYMPYDEIVTPSGSLITALRFQGSGPSDPSWVTPTGTNVTVELIGSSTGGTRSGSYRLYAFYVGNQDGSVSV